LPLALEATLGGLLLHEQVQRNAAQADQPPQHNVSVMRHFGDLQTAVGNGSTTRKELFPNIGDEAQMKRYRKLGSAEVESALLFLMAYVADQAPAGQQY
jgi:hypothetical protein